ncbi:glutathione S-transferase N-terminal domain-containing protein [Natronorubrum sp. A-ect3]|uniref:glutathione S-transferase N-terminal domain-containing protein n=1 Tax=Natronorubrum sp. A-ect3 TaxID=3242698 RepID=UPI00359DC3B8
MIELYRLRGCPYCRTVEQKLDELELEYECHNVSLFRFRRSDVKAVSGQSGVPVLVDPEHDVSGMVESEDIIAYLERTYG